jgi:hypothetical protein
LIGPRRWARCLSGASISYGQPIFPKFLRCKGSPMRAIPALITLLAASGRALAGNPYTAAGITNPVHVTQFVARLKQAVAPMIARP